MTIVNASKTAKTVSDPNAEYETLLPAWKRSRAVCSGESFVKAFDNVIDTLNFRNLLIPFSPTMSQQQYNFYKAEAELPGITAEFSKMLLGGLLRKVPTVSLPDSFPPEIKDWILNSFSQDDGPLLSFLDEAIWEELQTSRAWVYVDFPEIDEAEFDAMSEEDKKQLKPYPVLWKAEEVINWRQGMSKFGKMALLSVTTRSLEEVYEGDETHPKLVDTVRVHELDSQGFYQIRVFVSESETLSVPVIDGQKQHNKRVKNKFVEKPPIVNIKIRNERLSSIPAWPLNGQVKPTMPMLEAIINKEIALYNKMSRRNHLLHGAASYTPIISADMSDDKFDEIVEQGLGSWIRLPQGGTATVLATPTDALKDMETAIAANIAELAKLGIRMLSPETEQSGVALELRNAAQTAKLGSFSNRVSSIMEQVIALMIFWRYNIQFKLSDIHFNLSEDFNPTPLGADWLRLATEWYEKGLIPRSIWLEMLKLNDMIPPDYDDEEGKKEIAVDVEAALQLQARTDFAERAQSEFQRGE